MVKNLTLFSILLGLTAICQMASAQKIEIKSATKINPTTVEVRFAEGESMMLDFYGKNIFRVFQDNNGGIIRDPEAKPEAQILVDEPRRDAGDIKVEEQDNNIAIVTEQIKVVFDKQTATMQVTDLRTERMVVKQIEPIKFDSKGVAVNFASEDDEYFYGGGVQNGRFSHKGKIIAIENQNSWTDGGVASPTPFYWSTNGYGIMWHTFKKGKYDFGATDSGVVALSHEENYADFFVMVSEKPVALLNDFYQLTGNPVLLPKFGFYQGHLNAYNRDYWLETEEGGILFEDGKRYKESQQDNGGIKESLNGEKGNYQFSARAVIDRYEQYDMPLGWLLPNDGYGAGYGQTETLDGNIQNLKELGDYARQKGVEIGLWTQSDHHPKADVSALLQRDIVKEVRDAGVRVLKTDVAWVGAGYSFGLNGIADVAQIMPYYGSDARPFIISLDGWAGTQRYAGIWTGDQSGGEWEYIRFHIPTYIGSGLSGQPNISSDMDGIFGGKKPIINTRDFQWKTFSPMQLNMDGWGANEKYPHALGEPATSINRWYLKLKAELMPYTYSIAQESIDGMPMIRAMMLEWPNRYTLGTATRYQFMYGPSFLIAPIYQDTAADEEGNDIRNGIYLPEGEWYDYFTGERYEGGSVINYYVSPIWKLPIFVREGAIIPMTSIHNNPNQIDKHLRIYELYPTVSNSFTEYDDDGRTEAYRRGENATTKIESATNNGKVVITINPTEGGFDGFEPMKRTHLRVNISQAPKRISAKVNSRKVALKQVVSLQELEQNDNCYYYEARPDVTRHSTKGSLLENLQIAKNPVLHIKLAEADITATSQVITIDGYEFNIDNRLRVKEGELQKPQFTLDENCIRPYEVTPKWTKVENADYYEIEFDNMLYSTIRSDSLAFGDLKADTEYNFCLRAVNAEGTSEWAECNVRTKRNPLEWAIKGIKGEASTPAQGGASLSLLFDFSEAGNIWHTAYGKDALPLEIIADLRSVNTLDKMHYIPRDNAGNGNILAGKVYVSEDKQNWSEAGDFAWERNNKTKLFTFENKPSARYVKVVVSKSVGNFGTGKELFIFKVPNSESYIQGDINNDGKIDANDLTSYMNYTGLRRGDGDFEGYISRGDINANGLIDAYDVSTAATMLDGGVRGGKPITGDVIISSDKTDYKAGDEVVITVEGKALAGVNALSFALPYNQQDYEYIGIEPTGMQQMENLTNDRLHTSGEKSLYPMFVNTGNKPTIEGDTALMTIRFKAKRNIKFDLKAIDGFMVDKQLGVKQF